MHLSESERLIVGAAIGSDPAICREKFQQWVRWWSNRGGWNEMAPVAELSLLGRIEDRARVSQLDPENSSRIIGVRNANWVSTTRQMKLFSQVAAQLLSCSPVMLLKGAAFIVSGTPKSSRRQNDVDVLIPFDRISNVLEWLEANAFIPNLDTTYDEIRKRLVCRRDGWNFTHANGCQVDLHWKLFQHMGETSSLDAIAWKQATKTADCNGSFALLKPEIAAVYALYHAFSRGDDRDRLQHLVDIADVMQQCDVSEVLRHSKSVGLLAEMRERLTILQDMGCGIHLPPPSAMPDSRIRPPSPPWERHIQPERGFRKLLRRIRYRPRAEALDLGLIQSISKYKLWLAVGSPRVIDKFRRQPVTSPIHPVVTTGTKTFMMSKVDDRSAILGPGWSWRDDEQMCVWSDRPDSRVLINTGDPCSGVITLIIDPIARRRFDPGGKFSCIPRGEVIVAGRVVATYDFRDPRQPLAIDIGFVTKQPEPWVEISIMSAPLANHRQLGPVYDAWRRSVPLSSVQVTIDERSYP